MDARLVIAGLLVVGFVITAANGIAGYRGARSRLRRASVRISASPRFAAETSGAGGTAAVDAGADPTGTRSAHEAIDAIDDVLRSSRTSLLLAGIGLLVSATATLWDVFL